MPLLHSVEFRRPWKYLKSKETKVTKNEKKQREKRERKRLWRSTDTAVDNTLTDNRHQHLLPARKLKVQVVFTSAEINSNEASKAGKCLRGNFQQRVLNYPKEAQRTDMKAFHTAVNDKRQIRLSRLRLGQRREIILEVFVCSISSLTHY